MIERLLGLVMVALASQGARQIAVKLARPNLGPVDMGIDRRMADPVLRSLQPEPAGDLL